MKLKPTFLITTFVTAITISQPNAFAHGAEEHHNDAPSHHEHADAHAATTARQAFDEVSASVKSLDTMVASGHLSGMHEEIEKTEALIAIIKSKADVSADKKPRLEAALKQLTAQLGKVHTASDKNDKAATQAELKKAHSALKLVEANLK